MDPATGTYSQKLAHACDMTFLRNTPDWQQVRTRPKSFVDRLLMLDEEKRMTAKQALHHEWFSNEVHKTNFEELYQRTIKHWRPRPQRRDLVESRDASFVQSLMFPRRMISEPDTRDQRVRTPIEPHCKPVPKGMFSKIWPKKGKAKSFASPEVQAAIRIYWPSQWKTRELFDDEDEDDEEEERSVWKARRHGLLRPASAGGNSPLAQGQRSRSAPPRLTTWLHPPTSRSANAGKRRSPSTASNSALMRLQAPKTATNRLSTVFNGRRSPLRAYTSSGGPDVNVSPEGESTKAKATAVAWTPINLLVPLAIRDRTIPSRPISCDQSPAAPQLEQSSEMGLSRNTKVSPAISTAPAIVVATPVRTGKLKRWLTSPVRDDASSRSSTKRPRGSVFDIEEDDDDDEMEMSPTHERASKRTKLFQSSSICGHAEDEENDANDNETTLPHHPVSLRKTLPASTIDGLYLPR